MRYGSVCSGIEAASCAWGPLGWKAQWFSEVDPFASAVLSARYPSIPNLGDMQELHNTEQFRGTTVDLLVGGTPCQSFSVAGLRTGLADPRGNLALVFLGIADKARPRWLVWENVPGVLSSNGGRDFGAFLGGLGELGYGFAYRVLDAQYFGVPQRRRRVFVVGYIGDWRRAAAVLFERESLRGNTATGREPQLQLAKCLTAGTGKRYDAETETIVVDARQSPVNSQGVSLPLGAQDRGHAVVESLQKPRRLTPRECERLQGFPSDWTLVEYHGKQATDTPRYKAIGNSMAVPVMAWIGQRIQEVENRHAK